VSSLCLCCDDAHSANVRADRDQPKVREATPLLLSLLHFPVLALDNVTVTISGADLLCGVSLGIAAGTVTALVGPNGAGKSTLLAVASGERVPARGTVRLDGKPLAAYAPEALARRRAVLPQEAMLAFGFTGREVALLGRTPHPTSRAEDERSALRALDAADVLHLAERRYTTCSGGEKQRLHLARVLAQLDGPDASLLLLDEPTAALDLAHQHRVLAAARRLAHARGLAVVAVLHDLNLAAQYADRIAVLDRGRLAAEGKPADVLTPDVLRAVFGVEVVVVPHPALACPLVVPLPGDPDVPSADPYRLPVLAARA